MKNNRINPILFKSINETGRAITLVSTDSERTFATYLGAAIELSTEDLDSKIFSGYNYLYIEGYLVQNHDLLKKALRLAKKKKLKICIDLASFNIVDDHKEFFMEIIEEYVDIVFGNNQEVFSLIGEKPEEAAVALGELTNIAVVKLGAEGSLIRANGETIRVGVRPSKPVDTTGAGDLYAAGFLYGLIHGMSYKLCGQIGAILSGKVIEGNGAKMTEATWENLRREIKAISE